MSVTVHASGAQGGSGAQGLASLMKALESGYGIRNSLTQNDLMKQQIASSEQANEIAAQKAANDQTMFQAAQAVAKRQNAPLNMTDAATGQAVASDNPGLADFIANMKQANPNLKMSAGVPYSENSLKDLLGNYQAAQKGIADIGLANAGAYEKKGLGRKANAEAGVAELGLQPGALDPQSAEVAKNLATKWNDSSSRSPTGAVRIQKRGAEKIMLLFSQLGLPPGVVADPNESTEQAIARASQANPSKVEEFVKSMDSQLSQGGSGSEAGKESLRNPTWEALRAKSKQFFANKPSPAQQGEFIVDQMNTIKGEHALATNELNRIMDADLAANPMLAMRHPELVADMKKKSLAGEYAPANYKTATPEHYQAIKNLDAPGLAERLFGGSSKRDQTSTPAQLPYSREEIRHEYLKRNGLNKSTVVGP